MTAAAQLTQQFDDEAGFRKYIRTWVRNNPGDAPAKLSADILAVGFTHDEALAAVCVMLPDYVAQARRSQGAQARRVSPAIEEEDVFEAEAAKIVGSIPHAEQRRKARAKARQRQKYASRITAETEWEEILNSPVTVPHLSHKTWREMTVDDLDYYIDYRNKLAQDVRAEAQRMEILRAHMVEHGLSTVAELDAATGLELLGR